MTRARARSIPFCWVSAFIGTLVILYTLPTFAQAPSFKPAVSYASGAYLPTSVAVGDVNGDGILDIVVANVCAEVGTCPGPQNGGNVCFSEEYCSHGAVSVLLGNGDGTFRPAVIYETGGYLSTSVALGDLNGDGKLDLVVTNQCGAFPIDSDGNCPYATVDVMYGNGDGTFGLPFSSGLSGWIPVSVALGDLNGDGRPDVVVADLCSMPNKCTDEGCTCTAGLVEALGRIYDSGAPFARSVALGDVNRDGKLDVLVGNDGYVGVLLGNGDGTLKPAVTYRSAALITVADVNSDGEPDLVGLSSGYPLGSGSVLVSLGNGDGTFKTWTTYSTGGVYPRPLAVVDVNGDGRLDLVVANGSDLTGNLSVGVLTGNGDGTFQAPVVFDSGAYGSDSVAAGDLNGDGKPDVVTVNSGGLGLGVLLNNSKTQKRATSTTLTSSLSPSIYGQKVTFTAQVTTTGPVPPSGTIVFMWKYFTQTYTIGSAILNSTGVATLTKSNLNAGTYPVTAVYKGDTNNLGSSSTVLNQTVLQTTTKATLTSSLNPSTVGQAVTFTAKFTSPTVTPTGPVTFMTGSTSLGNV